jgi:hypothetical protein
VSTFRSLVCTMYTQMEPTWIHNWSALGTPFIARVQLINCGYQSGTKSRYTYKANTRIYPYIHIFILFILFYFEVNKSTILSFPWQSTFSEETWEMGNVSLQRLGTWKNVGIPYKVRSLGWGTWNCKDWEREWTYSLQQRALTQMGNLRACSWWRQRTPERTF